MTTVATHTGIGRYYRLKIKRQHPVWVEVISNSRSLHVYREVSDDGDNEQYDAKTNKFKEKVLVVDPALITYRKPAAFSNKYLEMELLFDDYRRCPYIGQQVEDIVVQGWTRITKKED